MAGAKTAFLADASEEEKAVVEILNKLAASTSREELIERFDQLGESYGVPSGVSVERIHVAHMPAEWLVADDAGENVVLFLHGGSYSAGSLRSYRHYAAQVAKVMKGRALLIEYRLAPTHLFPAALDDAITAYRFLVNEQGVDPRRISLMGDSVGGNLVLVTLLALRDRGLPLPACGVCVSPWTDYLSTGKSGFTKAALDPIASREKAIKLGEVYFANTDMTKPPATVLNANLSGLPPLLIQVGSYEAVLDDSTRFATLAAHADVAVTLQVWPRMVHTFQSFYPILTAAKKSIDHAAAFINEHSGSGAG